jgi:hypothetical protein
MPTEFIAVSSVLMPFAVEILKKFLPDYDARFHAGIVSALFAIAYVALVNYAPEQFFTVAASTFAIGTAIYKLQKPTPKP